MNKRKIPNFFIVGAAKAGTSTLWKCLKEHPHIYMPDDELYKEPGFFSDLYGIEDFAKYLNLFAHARSFHKAIGEATTAYLTDPFSARNIKKIIPDAKIIIILRNPADRAYSLYNWMVQEGYEYAPSFEQALKLEDKRINKKIPNFWEPGYKWDYLYFRSGLYYEQVERYIDLFSNILILKFDDFIYNPIITYQNICDFLEIGFHPIHFKKENISYSVYHPYLQFALRKLINFFNFLKNKFIDIKTKKDRDRLMLLGVKKNKPTKLERHIRTELLKRYKEDIEKLSDLTNIDFTYWLTE